ncbi:MAG: glyceraldehyde 3-phosphate dehydrogenase [Parcubacteria group bacterium Gr01-1014_66]|nr:MAG: glyceraldehyde 3-phosphate dehydrogenase [Parcubacteria group bacterium Gr01-1014_66]
MKRARIAINGFGRIGRSFFRGACKLPEFEIVAINDLTDTRTLAYLLKYDSVYGRFDTHVEVGDGVLIVSNTQIKVLAEKDPAKLPWRDLGVDVVIESSGFFTSYDKAKSHLDAGAKRVVITAPATGDVTTALVGVNDDRFENPGAITTNATCTTNSAGPVMAILLGYFKIEKATMVTVHGYTATQKLIDGPDGKDPRRGRAAAVNIVPSTTGAAEAVIQALPQLAGKFDATAVRVPIVAGSVSVISVLIDRATTREEINDLFQAQTQTPRWQKTLKVTDDPIVSTDIIGEPYGAIIDILMTKVVDGNLVTIFSWYDNEAGYTATLIEHVRRITEKLQEVT